MSQPAQRRHGASRWYVLLAGTAYLVTSQLAFLLDPRDTGIVVVWPAAGVAAASLILLGRHHGRLLLVTIAAVNFGLNLVHGNEPATSVGFAVANAAEPWMVAFLYRRWVGDGRIHELRDWARFLGACVGGLVVGTALGSSVVSLSFGAAWTDAALAWAVPDGVGLLLVTPLLLMPGKAIWPDAVPSRYVGELTLATGAQLAVVVAVMNATDSQVRAYMMLPGLVWAATRFPPRVVGAVFALTSLVVVAMHQYGGHGPFADLPEVAGHRVMQLFLAIMAVTVLSLALASFQARRAREEVQTAAVGLERIFTESLTGLGVLGYEPDDSLVLHDLNPAARTMLQVPQGAPFPRLEDVLAESERERFRQAARDVNRGELRSWASEVEFRINGEETWLELGLSSVRVEFSQLPQDLSVQMVDVTARKRAERELLRMATRDPLTGLPNRAMILERLTQELATAGRSGDSVAVLFMDLDDFKIVNDVSGHHVGDELLKAVAELLSAVVRPGDTLGRLGGDEFVCICPGVADLATARQVSDRAIRVLSHPIRVGGIEHAIGVSIGVSIGDASTTAVEMLREADSAMYAAKRKGKARAEAYDVSLQVRALRTAELATRIRAALESEELVLHYQPIVELETLRIAAVEALVRWQHPERGLLLPAAWLDVTERSDLGVAVGRWVLREACRTAAAWQVSLGERAPAVHVNVAAQQFLHRGFFEDVSGVLEEHAVTPNRLILELTESQLMTAGPSVRRDLDRLRGLGIRIAADDFGTGYSSLSHLTNLAVDAIKIDRSFVSSMLVDRRAHAVVEAVVTLGENLGLDVVAEGVETSEQAHDLRAIGCRSAQGFLWSRARPAVEVPQQIDDSYLIPSGAPVGRAAASGEHGVVRQRTSTEGP